MKEAKQMREREVKLKGKEGSLKKFKKEEKFKKHG